MWSFIETMNLHFSNTQETQMSSITYEENGYIDDLDLLAISYEFGVSYLGVHFYLFYVKICIFKCMFKYSTTFEVFFMFLIINSLLQSTHANRANIDTHNFVNCSILPYSISIVKLNGNVEALNPATRTDQYQNTNFASGDDICLVLDQYLGGEELEELILEEENVFWLWFTIKDLKDWCLNDFQLKNI